MSNASILYACSWQMPRLMTTSIRLNLSVVLGYFRFRKWLSHCFWVSLSPQVLWFWIETYLGFRLRLDNSIQFPVSETLVSPGPGWHAEHVPDVRHGPALCARDAPGECWCRHLPRHWHHPSWWPCKLMEKLSVSSAADKKLSLL